MRAACLLAAAVAALWRPAAATILVIEQHDQTAEYQMEDSASQFGPAVGITGLAGYLVLGQPVDGCEPLDGPPVAGSHRTWLVLLAAGNCSDGSKVLHAQQAGFKAAIVHNVTGDGYSPMESDVTVTIPSFFIGESNGIMLQANFLYGSGYTVYITGYFPYTFLAFIVPAMLLILLCLLVMIAIMLYRCVNEYRRTARRLLPKRTLAQIPTRTFSAGGARDHDTCAICLEDYQEGDQLRLLPCQHAFHSRCVDPWLLRSRRVCPVCKRRLMSATVAVLVSDSEEEQLLPVYRSQRSTPVWRTYGATHTARGMPPVPVPTLAAFAAAAEPQVHTRPPAARSTRRTRRRRAEERPAATTSPPADHRTPAAADAATAGDTATTDDALLLADDCGRHDDAAAAASPTQDAEATVTPSGGARAKHRPGQYTRLEEPTGSCEMVAGGSAGAGDGPAETEDQPGPPSTIRPISVSVAPTEGEQPQTSPPPAAAAPAVGEDVV